MEENGAIQACEMLLKKRMIYNIEHKIDHAENFLIQQLLDRRDEMADVYAELIKKYQEIQIEVFFDAVLTITNHWNPEACKRIRESKKQLDEINGNIAKRLFEVSELLGKREALQNAESLWSGTHYHVCDVIKDAAIENGHFNSYVKNDLKRLTSQYDLKYWPSVKEFINVLAEDSRDAEISFCDPVTEVATSGVKASLTDYFKALFLRIEEASTIYGGFLPPNFEFSNKSWSTLANCCLDIPVDRLITDEYMRRLKQRMKEEKERIEASL